MLRSRLRLVGALGVTALAVSACGSSEAGSAPDPTSGTTDAAATIAVTSEGGVAVLDATTLEVLGEFDTEEFVRVNPVGDGQSVLVSTSSGFQVLDTATPQLTDLVLDATTPGHVVQHGEHTILYDDGTGDTTIFETSELAGADELPQTEVVPAASPHHGVSVLLEDDTLLTTVGTPDERSGIRVLDEHRDEVAASDACPGVHGEGTAADEAVVFGCEDGVLLVGDGEITKLEAPDAYGRTGNAYVSESSPLVVGDYQDDPDAEGSLLDQLVVIDTEQATHEVIDLPDGVEYTYRGVVRGPDDLAYVIATDGSIHVLDPASGELTDAFPVIDAWEGPAEWQDPHPTLETDGEIGYLTDPATSSVLAIDLATGEVLESVELDGVPNEIAVTNG